MALLRNSHMRRDIEISTLAGPIIGARYCGRLGAAGGFRK